MQQFRLLHCRHTTPHRCIVWKYDVIRQTGSTHRNAASWGPGHSQQAQTTGKVWSCGFGDIQASGQTNTDRQTSRRTHHNNPCIRREYTWATPGEYYWHYGILLLTTVERVLVFDCNIIVIIINSTWHKQYVARSAMQQVIISLLSSALTYIEDSCSDTIALIFIERCYLVFLYKPRYVTWRW